ncbi:FAD-dependent oxidoreductase [Planococcus liqunii]|uniref:FAD-dependent oxidoreductase n=1 Tax=Planococcus liqunii TaxID=3058394 RepID=A0ABT8MTC4_9BACL|nr:MULTISPECIES: FAD-dependent oxidoreductase [unclassified Planococcus (in: firmicutes)]MDN7228152.1 FAD-dependent oxidoreductase [Planococcus sp. N064]WKA49325.1 FAD-dependent oxidoreductase [Planococcus sp. N056]
MGETYNLIIVGAGMAGLCAAAEAAAQGAAVLVLEKEADFGGSSLLSGRYMAFAGTDLQHQEGINDESRFLVDDMLAVGEGKNETELVEAYGKRQLETYEWLVSKGVEFHKVQAVSGHSVPRGHTITPQQAITALYRAAAESGTVSFKTGASVKRLRKDEDGRVSQVIFEHAGKTETATAENGVLLTSGGFSRSEDLLQNFAPHLSGAIRIGGKGNVGDGIKLASEQGAWLRDFPYLKGTYGFHPSADGPRKSQALAFYKGAIIINKFAERFVNESISYKLIGSEALLQPEGITYQVWDQSIMDQGVPGDALYDFDKLLALGLIEKADTLEGLAEIMGVPAGSLKSTINEYNRDIQNGGDQKFGRSTLTHHFGTPAPIGNSPFYTMRTTVAMLATYAGVSVDPSAQVLNAFNEPIEGLYAAGEIAGGFHGAGYMTGSSLGKAAIFGRIAVQAALQKQTVL